jgi:hypothetical protein
MCAEKGKRRLMDSPRYIKKAYLGECGCPENSEVSC